MCGASLASHSPAVEPHGERKQATVLFADIVGSTELIAGLDAEQAGSRLRPVVAAMTEAVQRFDGVVLGRLGDGIRVIFGAPRAHEGHALLACQAALTMQEAILSQAQPTQIRVGVHSGEVVAGTLSWDSPDLQAEGMTLHVASRIEQAASPGEIFLSADCHELVRDYCEVQPAGTRQLRGIASPIEVFRLVGLKLRVASDRFRDVSLVPMRGRQRELGILKEALLDAERDVGSAIGIVALPGIGKSRLCYEFGEWCRRRQVDVFEARAHVFGKATPLLPVLELMRSLFRIGPSMEPAAARRQIEERLLRLDSSLADDLPFLADFLGLPVPELEGQSVDLKAWRARLLRVVQYMVKAGGSRTSVIIFEDLHWVDKPTQDFLEAVLKVVTGTKCMIVVNYRPTWRCPWLGLSQYRELALAELEDSDIDRLVSDLVGYDPSLSETVSRIATQSDGNPFFAEELVRALARSGVLTGERGHYRLASSGLHELILPPTVEAAIGARLDVLPEREKELLQVGAVIGKEYPAALAGDVVGISEREAKELFGRLCQLDLLKACNTVYGPGFAFRHPLIQEVGYAMQLRSRRTVLHAAVADALAGRDWGNRDEFAGLLSHHYEAAGQMTAAARRLSRSAAWIGRTNPNEAFRQWKKVRQLLGFQSAPSDIQKMRAIASASVLTFGWRVGITADEAEPYAEEALRYAREVGDNEAGAEVLIYYGRFKASTESADAYLALMEEALALPISDLGLIATIQGSVAQAHWMSGFLLKAVAASDAALKTMALRRQQGTNANVGLDVPPFTSFDVEHWIVCQKARVLVWLGRFDEANALLAQAFQAEGTDRESPVVQYIAHLASLELACHRNDPIAAHRHARRIRTYSDQTTIPYLHVYALFATARAKTCSLAYADAERDLQAGLEFAAQANVGREHEPHLLAELSYVQYCSGLFDEAAKTALSAIAMARHRHHRTAECLACMVRGAGLAAANGQVVKREAEQYLARAGELIRVTSAALLASRLETLRSDVYSRLH